MVSRVASTARAASPSSPRVVTPRLWDANAGIVAAARQTSDQAQEVGDAAETVSGRA
jgi:hypothetical protein